MAQIIEVFMKTQRLGRTEHMSSRIILGGSAFWVCEEDVAEQTLEQALAEGINHIDIAPDYGTAQKVAGHWIGAHRHQVFLGCKTQHRTYDAAWKDLENSLTLLHTERIDLYQFHAVCTQHDVEALFAPDGAAKVLLEAREQGLISWLGITGHAMLAPRVFLTVLERMDLDTIMFALNPRMFAEPTFRYDVEQLLQVAEERDLGVITIKAGSKAPWRDRIKTYTPWYEPYDTQNAITADVRFALSQPAVTAVTSAGDVRLLPLFVHAEAEFTPMSETEQTELIASRKNDTPIFSGGDMIF